MGVQKMRAQGRVVYFLSLCCVGLSKICWEPCSSSSTVQTVDIEGCRRRSTYPVSQDFRCGGRKGPPCTVLRGDVVHLDVTWQDAGHQNLTQEVYWQSFINVPWIGMETEIRKYVNGGDSCPGSKQTGVSKFRIPIKIQEMYPAGYYNLQWSIVDRTQKGDKTAACFLIAIK